MAIYFRNHHFSLLRLSLNSDFAKTENSHETPDTQFRQIYDLKFLQSLNEEYRKKPYSREFTQYDDEYQYQQAETRLQKLSKNMDLYNKRVLEVGCGGGYVSYKLAQVYGCSVTGIDIYESEVWQKQRHAGLDFRCVDLYKENPFRDESFDVIVSYVAWEHMRHPFEILQQCTKILKRGGQFFIRANLYRSPSASHLYRHIFFPYPHLLFDESIVRQYALSQGVEPQWIDAFYYVNKLAYPQYKEYFALLDLSVIYEEKNYATLDLEFYERFIDKLELYPIEDLELSFFNVILTRGSKDFEYRKRIMSYGIKTPETNPKTGDEAEFSITAFGLELTYAWYVLCGSTVVERGKYSENPSFRYTFTDKGTYRVKCYIKDKTGQKKIYVCLPFPVEN